MKGLSITALVLSIVSILLGLWALIVVTGGGAVGTFLGISQQVPTGVSVPATQVVPERASVTALRVRNDSAEVLRANVSTAAYQQQWDVALSETISLRMTVVPSFTAKDSVLTFDGWVLKSTELVGADQTMTGELRALENTLERVQNDSGLEAYRSDVQIWAVSNLDSAELLRVLEKASSDLQAAAQQAGAIVVVSGDASSFGFIASDDSDSTSTVVADSFTETLMTGEIVR